MVKSRLQLTQLMGPGDPTHIIKRNQPIPTEGKVKAGELVLAFESSKFPAVILCQHSGCFLSAAVL